MSIATGAVPGIAPEPSPSSTIGQQATPLLVLGGSGFAGRNLCRLLDDNGIECISASRSSGYDLREPEQVQALLKRVQPRTIVNCAAHVGSLNYVTQQAGDVVVNNSRMILALYEGVARMCPTARVINPIANCAYPGKSETFVEDEWWDGHLHRSVLSYGSTRRMLWAVAESFQMQYGVRSVHLLVPNMYGPYDSTDPNKAHALNALIAKFVRAKREAHPQVEVWGTGVAIREWLYAADFGRIVLRILADADLPGLAEPVNVGQHFGLSVRELVDIIRLEFGYEGKVVYDESKPDGALKKVMDERRFQRVFPNFAFTPLADGIRATIAYYEGIYPS